MTRAAVTYVPGSSPLHAADPRTKLVCATAIVVALFVTSSTRSILVLEAAILLGVMLGGISFSRVIASLRPIVPLFIMILLLQTLLDGDPAAGFAHGALLCSRVAALALLVLQVIGTTSSVQLVFALESLLAPLNAVRVPVSDVALMLSIALNFIPMMTDEFENLQRAQAARGIESRGRGPLHRVRLSVSLIVPLVVIAFKRSRSLAEAMHLRGYARATTRSRFREYQLGAIDVGLVILVTLVIATALLVA